MKEIRETYKELLIAIQAKIQTLTYSNEDSEYFNELILLEVQVKQLHINI